MLGFLFSFLATAFYDNAYGFFALKGNKFIELSILEPIKGRRRGRTWPVKILNVMDEKLLDSLISLKAFSCLSWNLNEQLFTKPYHFAIKPIISIITQTRKFSSSLLVLLGSDASEKTEKLLVGKLTKEIPFLGLEIPQIGLLTTPLLLFASLSLFCRDTKVPNNYSYNFYSNVVQSD